MSSFATYLIGFFVLIVGLAIAAYLLNAPTTWIVVGVIILLGLGILMGTSRTKRKTRRRPDLGGQQHRVRALTVRASRDQPTMRNDITIVWHELWLLTKI